MPLLPALSRAARRRAGAGAGVVAVLLTCLLAAASCGGDAEAPATDVPLAERHLPRAVNAPGTWSGDEGVHGPVAALGLAQRTRPVGVLDDQQSLRMFAVSATDGSASWLRLPGFSLERWGFAGGFDVSPDGEWIGWVRPERPSRRGRMKVAGWSLMNTTTGDVRRLEDPRFPSVRGTMADLEFSGDSRYLLTSYETPDESRVSRSHGHRFVAWDVSTGEPSVVEPPGHYWLPSLGSAPSGVVWSRRHEVFRADPSTGRRTTTRLPQYVVTASWGPDDTSFAYIARPSLHSHAPWQLYAGDSVASARTHAIELSMEGEPSQLLGWRDATHVVVGHYRDDVRVVDVTTGDVRVIDLHGYGEQVNAPYLAEGLWQQPLITPADPTGTSDPRRPWRWVGGGVLLAAGATGLILRRRRRAAR